MRRQTPRATRKDSLVPHTPRVLSDRRPPGAVAGGAARQGAAPEARARRGLIVIDYLQLMAVPGNSENRATEISQISRSLKGLAKELNVPVLALSQLNRSLETRTDTRPVMADLRESGAIEKDADVIVFI